MTFKDLGLVEPILDALDAQGYTDPTPIQEQSIPILLSGKDLLGCAQTGTGKTAAFSIPIIQNLLNDRRKVKGRRRVKALIVTPTRELAIQIGESFTAYGKNTGLKNTVIFGGVKQGAQTKALDEGVDVLIATPGRLLDLMSQGFISLRYIDYFVLDEADRMLDMGFIHDIRKLLAKLPDNRQSLFFSATMAKEIVDLSMKILYKPEQVVIEPEQTTAEKVEQALYFVAKKDKPKLLIELLQNKPFESVLVFTRTKYGADKVVKLLKRVNINSNAIHGNKTQGARQRALTEFKSGETNVLIATDIAARGIDVSGLSLVINYEIPNIPETYVHRIGRTGRAMASGVALSFCDVDERAYLRDIQKLINQTIPVVEEHSYVDETPMEESKHKPKAKKQHNHGRKPRPNNLRNSRGEKKGGKKPASAKPLKSGVSNDASTKPKRKFTIRRD